MNVEERLLENGFEDVMYFVNPSYDDALIGVTANDNKAVYDFDKMVTWLIQNEDMAGDDAIDFIEHNMLGAYFGEGTPIIIYPV